MRRLLRVGKWVLLTVIGVLIGVVIFLHTSWGRSFLRARIETAIAGSFPGSTVHAVEGSPFGTLTVKGIVVMGKAGKPLATVGATSVDVSLLSLFGKVVRVEHVDVSDVMIAPDNLPEKKPDEKPSSSSGGGSSWSIELPAVAVHRAKVVLPKETIDNIEIAASVRMPAGEPLSAVAAVKATWRGLAVEATAYARDRDALEIPFATVAAGAGGATVLGARIGDEYTGDAIARISPALATVLKIEDLPSEVLAMAHAGHHGEVAAFAALGETTVRAGGVLDLEKLSGRAVAVANDPRYGAAIVALDGDADHARGMIAGETVQQGQLVRTLVAVTGSRSGGWLTLGAASDAGFANTVATVTRTGDAFELAAATLNVHGKRIDIATPDGTHARASGLDVKVTARGPLWPQPKLRVDGSVVAGGVQYDPFGLDGALVRLTGIDVTRTQAVGRVHVETVGMKNADTPIGAASLDARVTAGFDGTLTAVLDHHELDTDVGGTWAGSGGTIAVAPETIVVKDLHTSSGAGGDVTLSATVTRETGDLVADVHARRVALATLVPGIAGTVSAKAQVARKGLAWDGTVAFRGKGVVAKPGQPPVDARGLLTINGRRIVLTASAATSSVGEVRVAAELDGPRDVTDVPAWKRLERRAIRSLSFTAVDVKLAGASPKLSGVVDGGAAITSDGAHGTLHLRGFHTIAGDIDADVSLGDAAKPGEIATTETVTLVGVAGAEGVVDIALPRYVFDPKAWKALGARVIADGHIHAKGVQITPEVVAKLGSKAPYHATVDLDAEIAEGATGATLAVDVKGIAGGAIVKPVDVHLDGAIDETGAHANVTASSGDLVLVEATAQAPLTVDDVQRGRVRGAKLAGTVTIGKPQVPVKDLLAIIGRHDVSAGTLEGAITLAGTVLAPTGTATITTHDVTVPSQIEGRAASRLADLSIKTTWDGTEGSVVIDGNEGKTGSLRLAAHGPLKLAKLEASLAAVNLDIAPFAVFAPGQFAAARGTLTASLQLHGFDPDTGDVSGKLLIRKGRLPLHDLIGTLRDGDIDVTIANHKIVATLKSKLGPGTVNGDATVTLAGSTPRTADVKLTIRQIALIRAFQPRIDADVTAHLTHAKQWTGDVAIDNGHVLVPSRAGQELLDAATPSDMIFVDGDVPKVAPLLQRPPPSKPWLVANVALGRTTIDVVDPQYQVNGALDGQFVLSLGGDGIGMDGSIDLQRGDIELLGQRSQLDHGSLVFDGTIDPLLDIKVVRDLSDITVAAEVTGRLSNYRLELTSDTGSYSQGELLAMFAGGSSSGDGEPGQAAATAGAGYLSSLLTSKLGKALPLDLKLNYTRGGSTSSDAVGVSRWITRNLYLEARKHPEARPDENATEGIIEYHLGPFLLQGDAGDRGYAGVDFGGRIDW
jgi:autotransporter translocation and assembly factor TamB